MPGRDGEAEGVIAALRALREAAPAADLVLERLLRRCVRGSRIAICFFQ